MSDYPFSGIDIGTLWHKTSGTTRVQNLNQFINSFLKNLRYKALPKNDKITYEYELYDPLVGYGKQIVTDFENNVIIHFEFITEGDEMAYKVNGYPLNAKKGDSVSMITFLNQQYGTDEDCEFYLTNQFENDSVNTREFKGFNSKISNYTITVKNVLGTPYSPENVNDYPNVSSYINNHLSLKVHNKNSHKIVDIFDYLMKRIASFFLTINDTSFQTLDLVNIHQLLDIENHPNFDKNKQESLNRGNLHLLQSSYSLDKPFQYNVIFNGKHNIISDENIDHMFAEKRIETETIYNSKFSDNIVTEIDKFDSLSKTTFANLFSSLQFSEGTFTYKDFESDDIEPVELGPYGLLHLSPSRNFFPRGFYWDEGFHLTTLKLYSSELSLKIIYDWFSVLMDKETGYIPRELFLGDDNKDGVEERWITQYGNVGNPDVLVWSFTDILDEALQNNDVEGLLLIKKLLIQDNLYEMFKKRFDWVIKLQSIENNEVNTCFKKSLISEKLKGIIEEKNIFKWKGQSNDHCFPSGLDDYPRGMTHNNEIPNFYTPDCEIHVDLMSWIILFSKNLQKLANFLQIEDEANYYKKFAEDTFKNLELLNYDTNKNMYCDVAVKSNDNKMEHVCHEGYVSLFPFMLRLIAKDDTEKLEHIVDILGNTEGLLSDFGIRSLSKKDQYYKTNENYWRSKIWVNMNYLILKSLHFYFGDNIDINSQLHAKASNIYKDVRTNIVENMYNNWQKNDLGIIFENYNDEGGDGMGVQGFTGWSSLIINILYELPNSL
ncbi:hypothetical protein ACO0SA_003984 [Hanseniaspora valbyensis]